MLERSVVSSFIIRRPPNPAAAAVAIDKDKNINDSDNDFELLLLKRSDKVRTHQGKWAGVSGGCEASDPDVEFRAEQEILEETQLERGRDVRLVKAGEKLVIEDQGLQTRWTVYPFLWKVEKREGGEEEVEVKLKIDWEHVEYRWVPVKEVLKDGGGIERVAGPTVPMLLETFRSVWESK